MATSREILRIDGESVYRVPPLEVPALGQAAPNYILQYSAVELFVARTKALNAGWVSSTVMVWMASASGTGCAKVNSHRFTEGSHPHAYYHHWS